MFKLGEDIKYHDCIAQPGTIAIHYNQYIGGEWFWSPQINLSGKKININSCYSDYIHAHLLSSSPACMHTHHGKLCTYFPGP